MTFPNLTLIPLLQVESAFWWDALPVDPEFIVGVLGFAVLFAVFGVRTAGAEEDAQGCGGCSSAGCGLDDCTSCELGAETGEHHGVSWRFAAASETRTWTKESRR